MFELNLEGLESYRRNHEFAQQRFKAYGEFLQSRGMVLKQVCADSFMWFHPDGTSPTQEELDELWMEFNEAQKGDTE